MDQLKEKIGQMIIVGFDGPTLNSQDAIVKAIIAKQIGGVILFDYNFKTKSYDKNIESPAQLKNLTQTLQHYAHNDLFIGIDYEGGRVNRLKSNKGFPETQSAAQIKSATQASQAALEMAQTLQSLGINLNFAPVLDVNRYAENPVIGKLERSFSSDPQIVTEYARIFAEAYKAHGVICAYKHFPGHGSSRGDTHAGLVDVTKTWDVCELEPYQRLLANTCMVMTAHVVHYGLDDQGYPASLSVKMTQDLLREQLKFDGVVVTDDMQMKAITDQYGVSDAVRLAVNAGADILVFGNQLVEEWQDPQEIVDIIYQQVKSGEISETQIEKAYHRIKKLKQLINK